MPPLSTQLNPSPKVSQIAYTIEQWLIQELPAGLTALSFNVTSVDVLVASNLRDLWRQAALNSQGLRILICWNGQTARGNFGDIAVDHRADNEWLIAVTRGRGYASERGDTLTGSSIEDSFYDAIELVRDTVRRLKCITDELIPDYRDTKPMQLGNLVIDGYLIRVTTANDFPAILNKPQP